MDEAEEKFDAQKPVRCRAAARKSAAKKQARTLYDVAVKNGWGPQIRLIPGTVARLKVTPA